MTTDLYPEGRRRRRGILAAIALLIGFLVPVTVQTVTTAADAHVDGCDGHVQRRADPYGEPYGYWTSNSWRGGMTYHAMRMNLNVIYLHCPNLDGPGKAKIKAWDWCWLFVDNPEHRTFQGVTFRGAAMDSDGKVVNGSPIRAGDDGTQQHCVTRYVPDAEERWMRYDANPRYTARFTVHLDGMADDDVVFRNGSGGTINQLGTNSYVIDDWF